MSVLNIIFPVIIFVSLAIIIFIVGKHLPEFKQLSEQKKFPKSDESNPVKIFLLKIFSYAKELFILIAEWLVGKIKESLNLLHSWLIKNRSKRKEKTKAAENFQESRQNDEKEEIAASFSSTERVKERADQFQKETEGPESKTGDSQEQEKEVEHGDAADRFFEKREEAAPPQPEADEKKAKRGKPGYFIQFKAKAKEIFLRGRKERLREVFSDEEEEAKDKEEFSDGVISVSDASSEKKPSQSNLIKEVVANQKTESAEDGSDDDLGVDRKILEKKLIKKIAQNPKDIENYRQLGELYLKIKNYSDSQECYRQILKVKPRDVDAKRKMERINLLKRFQ
ncbi:MAG: hypothetical protein U5L10_00590 [Candidatus Moranbacteria bacterium]|nr:hypothetical protein [Candidatus Moranbacteria bacterium]